MFMPWMFYHWTPDPTETELSEDLSFDLTPAEAFIHKLGSRLGDLELEDLAENLRRPFSFYDVLESDPGQWVKVQDLLTEERFTVIEKMGSKSMKTGDLLFGKVITVRDVCMFDGLAPFLMPPKFKVNVVHERKRFRDKSGLISPVVLREYDLELLKIFWDFYEELYNPAPPILTNTDGDLLVPHELTFSIESIEDTFEALHKLCFNTSRKELLEDADYAKDGRMKSLEFPWLRKGNKSSPAWDNTVLGHIRLENKKMKVEVNSLERKNKFLVILKKQLPSGWILKKTVVKDLRESLEQLKQRAPTIEEQARDRETEELNNSPEAQSYISKMNEGHWQSWPLIPLPALKGQTPVDAIKSKDGRAAVDALLTQFERDAKQRSLPGQTVDTFRNLRERLGL